MRGRGFGANRVQRVEFSHLIPDYEIETVSPPQADRAVAARRVDV
jgi:hypothetical protein